MNGIIHQTDLGASHFAQLRVLVRLVTSGDVTLGGNGPGTIYGTLNCRAGKRMRSKNRVFFRDEEQAVQAGFRPCTVCLPEKYAQWKKSL